MRHIIVALCAFAPATRGFAPPPLVAKAPPRPLTVTADAATAVAAADPAVIAAAVAVAGGLGIAVSKNKAGGGGGKAGKAGLAWDDNAKWLAKCKSGGVVSWYDAGLRLTEPPPGLAYNDNAKWLEQCKSGGVVSWYDSGLRLTEPPKPAPTPAARSAAPAPKRKPAPKRSVAMKPGECKPAWSGDAYGRSSWPEPEVAAAAMRAASKPAMQTPKRRAWSGGVYDAAGRVTAPPTREQQMKAKRMAAVARLLASSKKIPRAPLTRPTRRAYSGSAYPREKRAAKPRASLKARFGKPARVRRAALRVARRSLTVPLLPRRTGRVFKRAP